METVVNYLLGVLCRCLDRLFFEVCLMTYQIIGVISGVILIMLAASLVCWMTETDELE